MENQFDVRSSLIKNHFDVRSRLMENEFNVRSRLMENNFDMGSRFMKNQFVSPVMCVPNMMENQFVLLVMWALDRWKTSLYNLGVAIQIDVKPV